MPFILAWLKRPQGMTGNSTVYLLFSKPATTRALLTLPSCCPLRITLESTESLSKPSEGQNERANDEELVKASHVAERLPSRSILKDGASYSY